MKRLALVLLSTVGLLVCLAAIHDTQSRLADEVVVDRASHAWLAREAIIARAKVFVRSRPAIGRLDLSEPPTATVPFDRTATIDCSYVPKPTTGTTPKFDCRLADGTMIKIKYGKTPERLAEVAGTRLLAALGFGADEVTLQQQVHCLGCPPHPFVTRKTAEWFLAGSLIDWLVPSSTRRDFYWVSVERKMPDRAIEVEDFEGWDWAELDRVDPASGGATRAEIDALRLIAVFLGHWDNKARNQRLVCEGEHATDDSSEPCERPLLVIHDVGATFGPGKVEEPNWAATPIWADAASCTIHLPHRDGTFDTIRISEAGRALMAGRLRQLSEKQIAAIFTSAGFPDPATGDTNGDVTIWVRAFRDKVRQIDKRPACPGGDLATIR